MMNMRFASPLVALTIFFAAARPARADEGHSSAPTPSPPSSDPYAARRIIDVSLLAAGLAIAATGSYFAIKYDRAIGGCDSNGNCTQEDGRVPLGLGMVMLGGALAAVGGVLWLQIPSTPAHVSVVPNGLVVAGSF
jgi:hypothetical protein